MYIYMANIKFTKSLKVLIKKEKIHTPHESRVGLVNQKRPTNQS